MFFHEWFRAQRYNEEYWPIILMLQQERFFHSSFCTIHEIYEWALDALDEKQQLALYNAIKIWAKL